MTERGDDPNDAPEGLQDLHLAAPADTLIRFRKRASIVQNTRYVLERQVYAFWIVFNAVLKLVFKHVGVAITPAGNRQSQRYRRAVLHSKEQK